MFRRKWMVKLFGRSHQSYDIVNNIMSIMLNESRFKRGSIGYRKGDKATKIKCKLTRKKTKSLTEIG